MYGNTIYGIKEGTATVYCKTEDGLVSNNCKVTVEIQKPTGISLLENSMSVPIGDSKSLDYTLVPASSLSSVTWKSSNSAVAKVSDTGVVTGITAGQANISGTTDNGFSAICKVTVPPNPKSIQLNKTDIRLTEGKTDKLVATIYPSDAYSVLTWVSTDEKVATVTSSGEIYAKGQGVCQIKVTCSNGIEAVCNVTVPKTDTYLVVWHKNGEKATFHFDTSPRIKYDNEKLIVVSDRTVVSYVEGNIQKITIENENENSDSGIQGSINDGKEFPFSLSNAQHGSSIKIYNVKGQLLDTYTVGQNGFVYYSLDNYPAGIYIVQIGATTIKIHKK